MIAEKQSISDNYNLFFCFAFHAYFSRRGGTGGKGEDGDLINLSGSVWQFGKKKKVFKSPS